MGTCVSRFCGDRSGATAIQYGLIAALIAVVVTTAVGLLGVDLSGVFQLTSGFFP